MSGGPPGRVSAILAVYNGERFPAEAIRSMLEQTEPPDEILVVDDGSTDRSAAIARSFPEVTCLAQPNAGQSAALNRGVAASTGERLAFLDSGTSIGRRTCPLSRCARWRATLDTALSAPDLSCAAKRRATSASNHRASTGFRDVVTSRASLFSARA